MKKLLIFFLLFGINSAAQQYEVNKAIFSGIPSEAYIGKVPLDEIPVDLILVTLDAPAGLKMLGIANLAYKYCKIDYGQPYYSSQGDFSRQLCISQTASKKTRILAESIVFFNILKQNGWEYKDQVGMNESFQFIFEKKK